MHRVQLTYNISGGHPAQRDLHYAPRGFAPTAQMFEIRDEDGESGQE